jgi:hypothetical protein
MEEYYDDFDNSISHNAWWTLPTFISWLLKQRKRNIRQAYGINLTVILHSACIIEGFLYELMSSECGTPVYKKSIDDRLLIDLNQRLDNASWQLYQDLFKIVIGKKISDFTTHENWKAVIILFQLRNLLTHGKTIELKFYNKERVEPVLSGKYSTLYTYYKEIKLIDIKSDDFIPGAVDFVTSESADYFYNETKFLLEQLNEKIGKSESYNGLISDSYDIAFGE